MKTKIFKYSAIYFFICYLFYLMFDCQTFMHVLFHYTYFDIRYIMFVGIQIFWITLLYQIIYQYICLYPMMRTRLFHRTCLKVMMKQFWLYSCLFLCLHILICFIFFRQIPYFFILLTLIIHYIGFILVIFLKKFWNYSYIFIIIIILSVHFVV